MRGSTTPHPPPCRRWLRVALLVAGFSLAAVAGCSDETLAQRFGADEPSPGQPYSGLLQHPRITVAKTNPADVDTCALLTEQEVAAVEYAAPVGPPDHNGTLCSYRLPKPPGPRLSVGDLVLVHAAGDAHRGDRIMIRGNSAVRWRSASGGCEVTVAVNAPSDPSDDLSPTPELAIDIINVEQVDRCSAATDLATKAFDRLPPAPAGPGR